MNPFYNRASFVLGAAALSQLPPDSGAEVAFAGRSNAGKSSALNAITGIKSLARTSKVPGRTQQINIFQLDEQRRLVDLPGYGFAKAPKNVQRHWQTLIERYLQTRQSLHGLILLMDSRHPLTVTDQQLLDWCQASQMPVHILLTKSDKLSRGAAHAELQKLRATVSKSMGDLCSAQLFSALKKTGIEEAQDKLDEWLLTETLK